MDSEVEAVAKALAGHFGPLFEYLPPDKIDQRKAERNGVHYDNTKEDMREAARAAIDALDKARLVEGDVDEIAKNVVQGWEAWLSVGPSHDLKSSAELHKRIAAALTAERQARDRRVEEFIENWEGSPAWRDVLATCKDKVFASNWASVFRREMKDLAAAIRSRGDKP